MKLKASFLYASRILFPKSSRPGIATKSLIGSVICIAISLIPLVAVLTVSNGMIDGITQRLISLSSSHIEALSSKADYQTMISDTEAVKAVPGVIDAYPMITSNGLVSFGKKRTGVAVRAVSPSVFLSNHNYTELFECTEGNIQDFYSDDGKHCLIGKGISERLGVKTGDKIRFITMESGAAGNGFSMVPRLHSFTVAAVISSGYQELDSLWLFIPLETGKEILKNSHLMQIMIETKDAFSPELEAIQNRIRRSAGKNFRVYRWDELNRTQYENFSSTKILLIFIMLLIVLVASVNISSSLVMLVMERRNEIAILKSLGAGSEGIEGAFMITGLGTGLLGVIAGLPAGLLVSVNINQIISFFEKLLNFFASLLYFLMKGDINNFTEIHLLDEAYYLQVIPVHIPFGELFLIVFSTLLLSLVVSILPSRRAGRQKPLEILRNSR